MASYKFNKNYFDEIDTEEKAYWLGFIWCDGTVGHRMKGNYDEYAFKLDLMESDLNHLKKLKTSIESNHEIKIYKNGENSFSTVGSNICRLYICNKYFGEKLYNHYGLKPNRSSISQLKDKIPSELVRHFIRGVLDSDGSFNSYYCKNNNKKVNVAFSTFEELVLFINEHLYNIGLAESILKTQSRHKGKDGHCVSIKFSGANQAVRILDYLYKDASIYLDRKYHKYLEI